MIKLEGEEILTTSKNQRFFLTTHRVRYQNKSFLGSTIKSILLQEVKSCELRTTVSYKFLLKAFFAPIIINGVVFIINNYLFKSSLLQFFFGDINIAEDALLNIFYLSILVSIFYIITFFLSVKKVISFHGVGLTINLQLKWLDFEERESFISKVEAAKLERLEVSH